MPMPITYHIKFRQNVQCLVRSMFSFSAGNRLQGFANGSYETSFAPATLVRLFALSILLFLSTLLLRFASSVRSSLIIFFLRLERSFSAAFLWSSFSSSSWQSNLLTGWSSWTETRDELEKSCGRRYKRERWKFIDSWRYIIVSDSERDLWFNMAWRITWVFERGIEDDMIWSNEGWPPLHKRSWWNHCINQPGRWSSTLVVSISSSTLMVAGGGRAITLSIISCFKGEYQSQNEWWPFNYLCTF